MSSNPLTSPWQTPYQTPPFDEIKNEHYEPAFHHALKIARGEIQAIADNQEEPTFDNTLAALDRSGELLDSISNIFFNLLVCNTSKELQDIAQKIQPELTAFSNEISLNEKLFQRVKQVYEHRDSLNEEEKMVTEKSYRSFIRHGAQLEDAQKEEYKRLTMRLSQLTLQFSDNVLASTHAFSKTITDESLLSGLPASELDIAAAKAKAKGQEGWLFDLTMPSYQAIMKFADNRELRKEFFLKYASRSYKDAHDNTALVYEIASLRKQIAKLLGFSDYASYVLTERMAKDKAHVYELLETLEKPSRKAAEKEMQEMVDFARQNGFQVDFERWDMSYYAEKQRNSLFDFDEEELKVYFPLDKVIDGVFGLARQLYDLEFSETAEIPVYQKDVKTYYVHRKDQIIAVLYLDFFPRESKKGGAWMTSFRDQHKTADGKNIIPLISLVMNFTPATDNKPSLLTFKELTTFMHEFGHALHGMLSEVTYSSISGTSVPRDFVELPSQINENWASDIRFLQSFARHYQSGEVIPDSLVQKVKDMENFQAGYLSCRQLAFGFLDMMWHDEKEVNPDLEALEHEAMQVVDFFPRPKGCCTSTSFTHIFSGGYAAGYYGYKWAEVLDADAFSLFQETGIFNHETASKFHDCILCRGGSREAMRMFVDFRGREPKVEALLKRSGLM
jgi:peptidyl-dipeptidase Dcp